MRSLIGFLIGVAAGHTVHDLFGATAAMVISALAVASAVGMLFARYS